MRRLAIAFGLVMLLASPAYAQGPPNTLLDSVADLVAPLQDFLDDYAALATGDMTTAAADIWGAQLLSTEDTGQGVPSTSPPAEYYADAPEEARTVGYTLETLSDRDLTAMSALDFANWLGVAIALPFTFIRGLIDISTIMGPLGFFVSWLLLAALWVGIVYFVVFLISFIRSLLKLGETVMAGIGLLK
jgi:hypothetical protein